MGELSKYRGHVHRHEHQCQGTPADSLPVELQAASFSFELLCDFAKALLDLLGKNPAFHVIQDHPCRTVFAGLHETKPSRLVLVAGLVRLHNLKHFWIGLILAFRQLELEDDGTVL